MSFWTLSGLTLIRYSTMLWVYLGIRLFLCLGFIIGIMYYGASLKRKSIPTGTQPQKSRFVSLGIGWSPRKEERRQETDRRQSKRAQWIASMTLTLIIGVAIGYASRSYQLSSSTRKLPNTLILDQNQDGSYQMLLADGRKINATFCPDKNGNIDRSLVRGNKLKEFNFIQLHNCKDIYGFGLGYVAYTERGVRQVFSIPEEIADAR